MAFSPQFYYGYVDTREVQVFVGITTKYVIKKIPKNFSPCVRFIVKSSSLNGLEILQLSRNRWEITN